jgi:hypothetical protein
VAFSPDEKVMYVSMWGEATYQIMRDDGLAFSAATGTISYEPATSAGSTPATTPAKSAAGAAGVETMWATAFLAAMMAIN